MSGLMTVAEAAEFAGVCTRSIYYHLNKSFKLYPIYDDVLKVEKNNLMQLYPARNAGRKQKLKHIIPNREYMINQVMEQLTQEIYNGDTVKATKLFNIVKNI
nr:MAG: hypothetical protein [Caudoviricetes sp.]